MPIPPDIAISAELAQRDLRDITELEQSEAFNRYYLRRLRQMREELDRALHEDDMTHERREVTRCLVLQLTEILRMPSKDRAGCHRILSP